MEVRPITNNQMTCKGYVHKSIKNHVDKVVEKECNNLVSNANKDAIEVDAGKIKQIVEKGKTVLKKLQSFIESTHDKTAIKLDDDTGRLKITNPITKHNIKIYNCYSVNEEGISSEIWLSCRNNGRLLPKNEHKLVDLYILDSIADRLTETVEQSKIDECMLNHAQDDLKYEAKHEGNSIIGRFKARKKAKAIEKYADATGLESNARKDAEGYIQYAITTRHERKMADKAQKELEKRNAKLLKETMKS